MSDRDAVVRRRGAAGEQEDSGPEVGGEASEVRREAAELLRVGEQIINRTLAGDSLAFLKENRQLGGQ